MLNRARMVATSW